MLSEGVKVAEYVVGLVAAAARTRRRLRPAVGDPNTSRDSQIWD